MADSVAKYTEEFSARVFALRPHSLLDIGCGQGDFIAEAKARGIRTAGVDANPERAAAARGRGLDVQQADAQHLPFAGGAFEWSICMRSAHHFSDLQAGLSEALRVATEGVLVYDPWYDESIPSQATAAALDGWYKRPDRAQGHINNGPLPAGDFSAALPPEIPVSIEATYRLVSQQIDVTEAESKAREYIAPHRERDAFAAQLDVILDEAQSTGLSEAGALFLTIRRTTR